ncbi:hypothetical protein [Cohnella mopanensis]|nr:hypothetical protein [Cohnella mopanensis]
MDSEMMRRATSSRDPSSRIVRQILCQMELKSSMDIIEGPNGILYPAD